MNPLCRITGRVLHVGKRNIISTAGKALSFTEATMLSAGRVTVIVTIPDDVLPPSIGDDVDWLVEVSAFRDRTQFRMVEDYPVFADA